MKSLKERWKSQKASDYHVTERELKTNLTFSDTKVSKEDIESFKKMAEGSNKKTP